MKLWRVVSVAYCDDQVVVLASEELVGDLDDGDDECDRGVVREPALTGEVELE